MDAEAERNDKVQVDNREDTSKPAENGKDHSKDINMDDPGSTPVSASQRNHTHSPSSVRSSRRSREDRDDREHSRRSRDDRDDRDRKRRRSRTPHDDHDRDRERDRRRERDRDRDSRRERDRDRDRDRDYERRRERRRSEREYERERRHRDDERERRRSERRSPRRESPRPKRSPSPKLTEEEHERRSVFVYQLSARVGDRELAQFFSVNAGPVREARVITDRVTRRSKGVGYVEFRDVETVPKALALTGTHLLRIPIQVDYTEAEKNRQSNAGELNTAQTAAPSRIHVGSLNFNLTDTDVAAVFRPFGEIEFVDLHREPGTGKSKGYCFIQFKNPGSAQAALEKMDGFELAGRPIKVNTVVEKVNGLRGPVPGFVNGNEAQHSMIDSNQIGGGGSELIDGMSGGGGIPRHLLMEKLSRRATPDTPKAPTSRPNIPAATSKCVLLKNMFNPDEETEADWDSELRQDVKDEAENKYGPVDEIYVKKDSTEGEIYIKFNTLEASSAALTGLDGRWFGGRKVTAGYVTDAIMNANVK